MEYQRTADGKLERLNRPCVDTGMGLERIASVLQGKEEGEHESSPLRPIEIDVLTNKLIGKSDNFSTDSLARLMESTRNLLHSKFSNIFIPSDLSQVTALKVTLP